MTTAEGFEGSAPDLILTDTEGQPYTVSGAEVVMRAAARHWNALPMEQRREAVAGYVGMRLSADRVTPAEAAPSIHPFPRFAPAQREGA